MTRKPGLGPPILKIERLSDGRDPTAVDEFTQEPLAQSHARAPKIDNAQAHQDQANRAKAAAQRALLGLMHPKPFKPFKRRI